MKIISSFTAALATLPRPGGNGYHPRLLGVANIGIRSGLSPEVVAAALREHTPQGGRRVPDREIADAVQKAMACRSRFSTRYHTAHRWHKPRPTPEAIDAPAFMDALLAEAAGIEETDIWEASPVRIDWPPEQDAIEVLSRLYAPDDVLFIGDTYGRTVKTVAKWLADIRAGCQIPPHIIPNPLTGQAAQTKAGRPSLRADACVKSFRFAVAEFDGISRDDQLRFWWAINVPVCALIDSGGKSLHAWIRIDDIEIAEKWTAIVEGLLFGRHLIPLGCDAACRNEARLSRLPGHFRKEKGRWQRILYLAPKGRAIHASA